MRTYLVREHIAFKRGQDSKRALKVGSYENPIKIHYIDEEWVEDGPLIDHPDLLSALESGEEESWYESLGPEEVRELLGNWPAGVHEYLFYDEGMGFSPIHYLNGHVVEYEGEIYVLPESDLSESLSFTRDQNTKRGLQVGSYRPLKDGERIKILDRIYVYWPKGYRWADMNSDYTSEWVTEEDIRRRNLDSDKLNISLSAGDILQYDEETNNFYQKGRIGMTNIGEFIKSHPELWIRIQDIKESTQFKRTGDSKKSLGVGRWAEIQERFDLIKEYDTDIKIMSIGTFISRFILPELGYKIDSRAMNDQDVIPLRSYGAGVPSKSLILLKNPKNPAGNNWSLKIMGDIGNPHIYAEITVSRDNPPSKFNLGTPDDAHELIQKLDIAIKDTFKDEENYENI